MDATCTSADIRYPTDLSLLNEAREKTEQIVDCFHRHLVEKTGKVRKKPRTYRRKARRDYLEVARQKSPAKKKLRKAVGKQLRYLKRNPGHIKALVENVHVDRICRTRSNRAYCKEKGIRLSGKPLGRPRKPTADNPNELHAARAQCHQDELDRIPVEGKFGNSKRRGTPGRIMAKLSHTGESVIHVGLIVLNLQTWLRKTLICLYGKALHALERVFEKLACYFDGRKCCNYDRRKRANVHLNASA